MRRASSLGGDHYVTLSDPAAPMPRSHGPMSLIQFDAHTDTWADDDMDRIDHGTIVLQGDEARGSWIRQRSVQIGIRTTNPDTLGVPIIDARRGAMTSDREAVAERVHGDRRRPPGLSHLRHRRAGSGLRAGHRHAGLGRARAPRRRRCMLRGLAGINIAGGDMVEVSPPFDHRPASPRSRVRMWRWNSAA